MSILKLVTKMTSLALFSSILFCFSNAGYFLLETSSSMESEKSGLDYENIIGCEKGFKLNGKDSWRWNNGL